MTTVARSDSSKMSAAEVRQELDHPVLDGDGHVIESTALLHQHLDEVGGPGAVDRFRREYEQRPFLFSMGDLARGDQRGGWWIFTNDARDLATVIAPALLSERLGELGLDFVVLYPTSGLGLVTSPDEDMRLLSCRALNTMMADLTAPHRDVLAPAAVIPMHCPAEAIRELDHCVHELGFRVAMIPPGVARPWPAHESAFPTAQFVDRFGLESHHDYDGVWQRFVELGVAVTAHGGIGLRYLDCGRRSPTNYVFNHIGGFAYQQQELAKSLVLGGVPARFPALRFGFLEGGVGWAADLLYSLDEHWEKRSGSGLSAYDPGGLDETMLGELLARYLPTRGSDMSRLDPRQHVSAARQTGPWTRDEFSESGIIRERDLFGTFAMQFFFGCEADDPAVYRAFDGHGNAHGARLNAFFSSDIGHWDVPKLDQVLPSSRRLVDEGLLDDLTYREFAFTNAVRLHGGMNPAFFDGTSIEREARQVLG